MPLTENRTATTADATTKNRTGTALIAISHAQNVTDIATRIARKACHRWKAEPETTRGDWRI